MVDPRGASVGTALFAPNCPIALRVLAKEEVSFDRAFIRERLVTALGRRQRLFPNADAFRVVHGEADQLPGLFIDRYSDVSVIQTATAAMDRRESEIALL